MNDGLTFLAGQRRDAAIELYNSLLLWREFDFKSQILVRKQEGWRCLITQNSLDQATVRIVNNISLSEIYAYIHPYSTEEPIIYHVRSSLMDARRILSKMGLRDCALLGIGATKGEAQFLQCVMPNEDFAYFLGTNECFEIISKDKFFSYQWSEETVPADTQNGIDWVARRLAEVHDYDELFEGEWQTFTWGLGEYLELNNLTLEQYQRQKGWIP